jgi:hypothetical protein
MGVTQGPASACTVCLLLSWTVDHRQLSGIKLHTFSYVLDACFIWCACVSSGCCICCIGYTHVLQVYISNISSILDVCCSFCICMFRMLQLLYRYVVSVCFKYFICFKRTLQVFYLDVAYVTVAIHICCNQMFQMFHLFQTTYIATNASCCKWFY